VALPASPNVDQVSKAASMTTKADLLKLARSQVRLLADSWVAHFGLAQSDWISVYSPARQARSPLWSSPKSVPVQFSSHLDRFSLSTLLSCTLRLSAGRLQTSAIDLETGSRRRSCHARGVRRALLRDDAAGDRLPQLCRQREVHPRTRWQLGDSRPVSRVPFHVFPLFELTRLHTLAV
jgi:hypothetical protein